MGVLGFAYQFSLQVSLSVWLCTAVLWLEVPALSEAADWLESCLCQLDFNTKPEVMAWQLSFRKWENSFELFIVSKKLSKKANCNLKEPKVIWSNMMFVWLNVIEIKQSKFYYCKTFSIVLLFLPQKLPWRLNLSQNNRWIWITDF